MILTGISDEAGKDIHTQIKAHKELGWDYMELRLVDGKNVAGELEDAAFDEMCGLLGENNIKVTAFASRIANWSRPITGDFSEDVEDLKISIPRMQRLGVNYIRVMSWVKGDADEKFWFEEGVRRLKELSKMAEDAGIYLAHENCTGWGGLSARHMVEMKEAVDSPNLILLYDLGNVISHGDDPQEFFKIMREHFKYVHIKDATKNPAGGPSEDFQYCGEGDAMIRELLTKIIKEDGYDGVISIEPHVASIVHAGAHQADPEQIYTSYIRYASMLKDIVKDITG